MLGGPTLTPEAAAAIAAEQAGGRALRPQEAQGGEEAMIGLTFDTGALIALERRRQRMKDVMELALAI
jgi:hypothetical protein